MIKYFFLSFAFILILLLCGCRLNPNETTTQSTTDLIDTTTTGQVSMHFRTQYIRTNSMSVEDSVYRIESGKELSDYYSENKDKYYDKLGRTTADSADTIGFLDAIDKYDDDFFEDNLLVFILRIEPSGSYRHEVLDVLQGERAVEITIKRTLPDISTCDIAFWHIMVELKKSEYNGSEIVVDFE